MESKGQIHHADIATILASCKIQSIVASFSRDPTKHCKNTNYGKHSFGQKFGGQKFSADKIAEN